MELAPLFAPRSVVVYGASDAPGSWGRDVAERLLRAADERPVYFVSRRRRTVLGRPVAAGLDELPETPELAVLAVPAGALLEVAEEVAGAGVRAVVALAAGFGETGSAGREAERTLAARVREHGGLLLGPNCMGLVDVSARLFAAPWLEPPAGDVALISQSGNLALELAERMRGAGLGFSRFVSVGNQAGVTVDEVLDDCVVHRHTGAVAVYCESFVDGRAFVEAAARARAAGKPVVLLCPCRTPAGARAARSHTGALVSDSAVVDAACRAGGVARVWTPRQLVEALGALRSLPPARGRRVGVVTTGGGNGVIAADVLEAAGLEVPPLSAALAAAVARAAGESRPLANPVDLVGAVLNDPPRIVAVSDELARSGELDALLVTGSPFSMWHGVDDGLAEAEAASVPAFAELAARSPAPLVLCTDRPRVPAAVLARERGLVVHDDVDSSARVIRLLADASPEPPGLVPLPPTEPPVVEAGYWAARELVAALGIAVAPGALVEGTDDALAVARRLGYPVVLKAHAGAHKSDAGGVVTGIGEDAALTAALEDVRARLGPCPLSVEAMLRPAHGVELLVGCRRDRAFGPVAAVGAGGTLAELLAAPSVALAPLDEEAAHALIASTRVAPLLAGFRGAPPLALASAAGALATLSRLAAAHPEIEAIEINPLLVCEDEAVALDARIVLAPSTHDSEEPPP